MPDSATSLTPQATVSQPTLESCVNAFSNFPGPRGDLALYSMPCFLEWAIEALARSMRKGKDTVVAGALDLGLQRIGMFSEIGVIRTARLQALRAADPEGMHWFNNCNPVDVDAGGAGTHEGRYHRQIPKFLAANLSNLADELGLKDTHFAILLLTAGFLGSKHVAPRHQDAMVVTLKRFRDILIQRASRAPTYKSVPRPTLDDPASVYRFDALLSPADAGGVSVVRQLGDGTPGKAGDP